MGKQTKYIVVSIAMTTLILVSTAYGFKPYTHQYLANEAVKDAIDDCKVSIRFKGPLGIKKSYAIPKDTCRILRNKKYRANYFLGICGPDCQPDLATGQATAHGHHTPSKHGSLDGSDTWLNLVWRQSFGAGAPKDRETADRARAYALGYLTHAAGDLFAHTFVNAYADGPFSLDRGNYLRHMVVESFIAKHTPKHDLEKQKNSNMYGIGPTRKKSGWLYGTFIKKADELNMLNRFSTEATYLSIPINFLKLKKWLKPLPRWIGGGMRTQNHIDAGLKDWISTAQKINRFLTIVDPHDPIVPDPKVDCPKRWLQCTRVEAAKHYFEKWQKKNLCQMTAGKHRCAWNKYWDRKKDKLKKFVSKQVPGETKELYQEAYVKWKDLKKNVKGITLTKMCKLLKLEACHALDFLKGKHPKKSFERYLNSIRGKFSGDKGCLSDTLKRRHRPSQRQDRGKRHCISWDDLRATFGLHKKEQKFFNWKKSALPFNAVQISKMVLLNRLGMTQMMGDAIKIKCKNDTKCIRRLNGKLSPLLYKSKNIMLGWMNSMDAGRQWCQTQCDNLGSVAACKKEIKDNPHFIYNHNRHHKITDRALFAAANNELFFTLFQFHKGMASQDCKGITCPEGHFIYPKGKKCKKNWCASFERPQYNYKKGYHTCVRKTPMHTFYGFKWCNKCQGLHSGVAANKSRCPAGGRHSVKGSGNYGLSTGDIAAKNQAGWAPCAVCQTVFFGPGTAKSRCASGGRHYAASHDFHLAMSKPRGAHQAGWKWCRKCMSLHFGAAAAKSRCFAGGKHSIKGSGNYFLQTKKASGGKCPKGQGIYPRSMKCKPNWCAEAFYLKMTPKGHHTCAMKKNPCPNNGRYARGLHPRTKKCQKIWCAPNEYWRKGKDGYHRCTKCKVGYRNPRKTSSCSIKANPCGSGQFVHPNKNRCQASWCGRTHFMRQGKNGKFSCSRCPKGQSQHPRNPQLCRR